MASPPLTGYALTDQPSDPALPGISRQALGTFMVNCINLAVSDVRPAPVAELGIPLDAKYYEATLSDPLGMKGYSFEVVGTQATPTASPDAPRFIDRLNDDSPTSIIAWRRRVRSEDVPLILEARWSPTCAVTFALHWEATMQARKALAHPWVHTALTLLDAIRGGRRGGRTYMKSRYYTKETFLGSFAEKEAIARQLRQGEPVRNIDRAAAYGISIAQWYRYVHDYGHPSGS